MQLLFIIIMVLDMHQLTVWQFVRGRDTTAIIINVIKPDFFVSCSTFRTWHSYGNNKVLNCTVLGSPGTVHPTYTIYLYVKKKFVVEFKNIILNPLSQLQKYPKCL